MSSIWPSSLSQVDPVDAWRPWQPTVEQPWNLKWAGHLYRRAAFGAPPFVPGQSTWAGLPHAVQSGLDSCLERLFTGDEQLAAFDRLMDDMTPDSNFPDQAEFGSRLVPWWLYRLAYSPTPLRERMTLFWHNHFATSIVKVRQPDLMLRQNQLFRTHALGKFGPLLLAVSRDPAMLVWLDSNSNIRSSPNENYAREVMELFSLGVGNYTEHDIREAARAFTGWHVNNAGFDGFRSRSPGTPGAGFIFNAAEHDAGPKTVLGQSGSWDGADVVRIILEQPAAGRFLARKLYRTFISENEVPPDSLLEPLAEQLRKSDYDIGATVRTVLRSRIFFSSHAYRQRIKSPVEYVIHLVRSLDGHRPGSADGEASPDALAHAMQGLGQKLFAPPSVKGWDGGKTWLNTATLVARHNLALGVVTSRSERQPNLDMRESLSAGEPVLTDPVRLVSTHAGNDPGKQVAFLLDLCLQGDVDAGVKAKLTAFLGDGNPHGPEQARRLRQALHMILMLPEYQLA